MGDVFLKDRFVRRRQALVSVDDRSYRFGDGVFETFLVHNRKVFDFESHLHRLENGLRAVAIDLRVGCLGEICQELIERNGLENGYVRAIVSRGVNGPGAIGYTPRGAEPYLVVQTVERSFPEYQKLKLWISEYSPSHRLASKINSALPYVLAALEADSNGCDNALILKSSEHVCETASGNIFWFKGDTLFTPSLDLPLVPGTVRRQILDLWSGHVEEGRFPVSVLAEADEVLMSNIGCLIASITEIQPLGITPGDDTRTQALRRTLLAEIERQCS